MCETCGCNGSPTVTKATSAQNERTGGPDARSADVTPIAAPARTLRRRKRR
jgi:hypothetical protein